MCVWGSEVSLGWFSSRPTYLYSQDPPAPRLELTEYGKLEDPQVPETLSPLPPALGLRMPPPFSFLRIKLRFPRLRAFSQLSQIPSPPCNFFFLFHLPIYLIIEFGGKISLHNPGLA